METILMCMELISLYMVVGAIASAIVYTILRGPKALAEYIRMVIRCL